eukprot:SAG31_NODE_1498_length_8095_cov_9.582541_3_plen_455_part_00
MGQAYYDAHKPQSCHSQGCTSATHCGRPPCSNARDGSCPKQYTHWKDNAYLKLHGSHYWMDPCSNWGYSNYTSTALGCDRSSTGSGYTEQYPAELKNIYDDPATCPEELLLFFHNLPWTHKLRSGKTIMEHIDSSHAAGVDGAKRLQAVWSGLTGIDAELQAEVKSRFDLQISDAQFFSSVLLSYYREVTKPSSRAIKVDDDSGAIMWKVCDVKKYGAKGDNQTKDTRAINAAIAACADGGEILLPSPGRYLTGAVNLSSNQLLRVEEGATLVASQDTADFPEVASFPSYSGSRDIPNSTCRYGAVVGAVGAHNVTITGGGVLDGQGWHFWRLVDANHKVPGTLKCSRPHLVEFEHCADVTGMIFAMLKMLLNLVLIVFPDGFVVAVTDLTMQNSPFWTTHFIFSKRIRATDLTITAPADRGNTDGINPVSARPFNLGFVFPFVCPLISKHSLR